MPILPLPQFEADMKAHHAEEDRKVYESLRAPKTLVVRFGSMKLIGEFRTDGQMKPGCGSKVIVRTFRGTELGEMLTSTCPNSGCSKSVSRHDMLEYIENSGGRDYPFYTEGRVLRLATPKDMDDQAKVEQSKHETKAKARSVVKDLMPDLKVVEAEPILGGETLTVYIMSEERVELRDIARELEHSFRSRVEVRVVGARDEARLNADYEKCGQYCCCKNFLKVLRPVSMKSAKIQKATLDPLKISGRCGRLMCCLRYEDSTYEDLAKKLPRKKSRIGTPEGDGVVIDSQILTQLVLVALDASGEDGKPRHLAVAVEDLTPAKDAKGPAGTAPDRARDGPGGGQGVSRQDRPRDPRAGARGERPAPRRPEQGQAEGPSIKPPEQQRGGAGTPASDGEIDDLLGMNDAVDDLGFPRDGHDDAPPELPGPGGSGGPNKPHDGGPRAGGRSFRGPNRGPSK